MLILMYFIYVFFYKQCYHIFKEGINMKNNRKLVLFNMITLLLLGACSGDEPIMSSSNSYEDNLSSEPSLTPSIEDSSSVYVDDGSVDVIFLAGQSNAEGNTWVSCLEDNIEKGKLSQEQFDYYTDEMTTKIKFSVWDRRNYSDEFTNVKLGQGLTKGYFGPEIGMAEVFDQQENRREIIIVKFAKGATSLYSDWRSTSSVDDNHYVGKLYDDFVDYAYVALDELVEMGYKPHARALCWMQGEADSLDTTYSGVYKELEKNLVNDVQDYLSDYIYEDEGFHFVDALISTYEGWKFRNSINKSKTENAEENENFHIVDTSDLTYALEPSITNADYYHFDSLSMLELGRRFANTVLEIL